MKTEIKCPKCGEVFQVDESGYADIVGQIKQHEIEEEVEKRLAAAKEVSKKEAELEKAKAESDAQKASASYEKQIQELKAKLDGFEAAKKADFASKSEKAAEELGKKNEEIAKLKGDLQTQIVQAKADKDAALSAQTATIVELEGKLNAAKNEQKAAVDAAVAKKDLEISDLKGKIESQKANAELEKKNLEESHATILREKDAEIAQYKDLKAKLSTKMVGETLEQHCSISFEQIRPLLPGVYFEKDNDAKLGSKGDFIYRENDEEGNELLSIMFEMKNENETTATKHKNLDFLEELDKDRKEKKCEYAVLVSLLEKENDFYNAGIADMSGHYGKMYVIRPQCFIPMITILRNAAKNSAALRHELADLRAQNVDVVTFEKKLQDFQDGFTRNVDLAKKQHEAAIEQIDNAIKNLQKVRDSLTSSDNNLRLADDKVQGLTIRKLTHGNPTMAAKFKEATKEPKPGEGE